MQSLQDFPQADSSWITHSDGREIIIIVKIKNAIYHLIMLQIKSTTDTDSKTELQ